MRTVLGRLFKRYPTARELAAAGNADILALEQLLRPLGLFRKRARMLVRFSKEYLEMQVCVFCYWGMVSVRCPAPFSFPRLGCRTKYMQVFRLPIPLIV